MKTRCPRMECGWEWEYKGSKNEEGWITCPNCYNKAKLKKFQTEIQETITPQKRNYWDIKQKIQPKD